MTEQEVQAFCANNGISVSPVGQPLHVVDPTELPGSVRAFVNDDGTYKGDNTPESEDEGANGDEGGAEGEEEDLSSLTVTELKDQARELEISGFSSMTKDELVKAVKKAK